MQNQTKKTFKAKPWYYRRYLALIMMFLGFGAYFFYDGMYGYPKKQKIYEKYTEVKDIAVEFENYSLANVAKIDTKEFKTSWENKVRENNWEKFFEDTEKIEDKTPKELWTEYTLIKGWSDKIPKEYTQRQIHEQFVFGWIFCTIGFLILVYFLLTFHKTLSLEDDCVIFPSLFGYKKVKFAEISKVDRTKWHNKGLAYIYHNNVSGKLEKSKLDCLHFGEETEIVMQKILQNFSGELIDIENEPEKN